MSTRTLAAGKRVAKRLREKCDLQAILDDNVRGGHELYRFLAPVIVASSAAAAAAMRAQNRDFRAAIDEAILAYMRDDFNPRWKRVYAAVHRRGDGAPKQGRQPYHDHDMTDADVAADYSERLAAFEDAVELIDQFQKGTARVFGRDFAQCMIKAAQQYHDPSRRPDPQTRQTAVCCVDKPFVVGEDSVHFYLAAGHGRCEVCSVLGKRCLHRTMPSLAPNESLVVPEDGVGSGLHPRALWCGDACIDRQCITFNKMEHQPLKLTSQRAPRTVARNNNLLKAMLRNVGLSTPFHAQNIAQLIGVDEYSQYFEDRSFERDAAGAAERIDGRRNCRMWLGPHPTMPAGSSVQERLRLSGVVAAMAECDVSRQEAADAKIKALTAQVRMQKLVDDFDALVAADADLGAAGLRTLDEADNLYPGTKRTVEYILRGVLKEHAEEQPHALDQQFTRLALRTLSMTAGALRRWDQTFSWNATASGHAYAYVSGLCVGDTPAVCLADIASHLNHEPVAMHYSQSEWRTHVTAMHVFDALTWNQLQLDRTLQRPAAGSSTDPVDASRGLVAWTVVVGQGAGAAKITCETEPPRDRQSWLNIGKACRRRLDELDMWVEQGLPCAPSQAQIDAIFSSGEGESTDARIALDFLQVMAQTMAFAPETRAMGLDILTSDNTRGFIHAVAAAGLDLECLTMEHQIDKDADVEAA